MANPSPAKKVTRAKVRPRSPRAAKQVLNLLKQFESRNIIYIEPDGSWPIVWHRARGVEVWDIAGRRYLDLTAAFGVAAAGHANPRVVRAAQRQFARLGHAMGDVHPHALKAHLLRELSRMTFERWTAQAPPPPDARPLRLTGKTILGNSGFEAVEAALKTALLATGRRGIIAFEGAYHGLGYGALNATHRAHFRSPFQTQLGRFGHFVPFPTRAADLPQLERALTKVFRQADIGAVLVEPVQGRGGIRVPPPAFLPRLREICHRHQALLILDEIYTGFGRTGAWFACEHTRTVPDLICLGKGLTGGFPLSACVGRADIMDAAWPASSGEAIHTSTFLGHPVGCAMALAQIAQIRRRHLVERARQLGHYLQALCQPLLQNHPERLSFRGLGLMAGIDVHQPDGRPDSVAALSVIKQMLRRGFILLPEGETGSVISLTPPLTITQAQLKKTIAEMQSLFLELWPDASAPGSLPVVAYPAAT